MRYRFISIEPSGNGTDFILAVESRPNAWQRLLGERVGIVEFFGPHPHWVTMEGLPVGPAEQRVLQQLWKLHLPTSGDWRRGAPWAALEPAPEDGHRFAAGDLRPSEEKSRRQPSGLAH